MRYHSYMTALLNNILGNPRLALFAFAAASATALAAAFISQYAYGLQPCILCVYQRIPYALVIFFAVLGIGLGRASVRPAKFFLGLVSITFLANSVIAAYHTGVERKWWPSFLEGCTIPKMEGNITDVLAQIEASPIVRCDEIPWTDPFFGLSMANYNVLFCLVLAIAAAIACCRARQH
jgi:disulfide bond formation protein DsbB